MGRFQDWPRRLDAALEAGRDVGFKWGEHDCALFACTCVEAITGRDPAAQFRGRYRSRAGARTALRRRGFANLEAAADALLGPRRPGPLFAQRGDLVMVDTDLGPALAVCDGRVAWAAGDVGRKPAAMESWRIAWEI